LNRSKKSKNDVRSLLPLSVGLSLVAVGCWGYTRGYTSRAAWLKAFNLERDQNRYAIAMLSSDLIETRWIGDGLTPGQKTFDMQGQALGRHLHRLFIRGSGRYYAKEVGE
jgi:hypothetical protein